jgi:hypothetical protein
MKFKAPASSRAFCLGSVANVRFGSEADVRASRSHVGSVPIPDIVAEAAKENGNKKPGDLTGLCAVCELK